MNKITKKFMLSILALVFAFVAVGSTTYAWFTLSNKVEVKKFQMNVRASSGLEIKAKITALEDDVKKNDAAFLTAPWYSGVLPYTVPANTALESISLANALTDATPDFKKFYREYETVYFQDTQYDENLHEYVKIDLYFRSSEAKSVYLTDKAYIHTNDINDVNTDGNTEDAVVNSWTADIAFGTSPVVNKGDVIKYNAGNAIRMLVKTSNNTNLVFENKEATGANTVENTTGLQPIPTLENVYDEENDPLHEKPIGKALTPTPEKALAHFIAKTNVTSFHAGEQVWIHDETVTTAVEDHEHDVKAYPVTIHDSYKTATTNKLGTMTKLVELEEAEVADEAATGYKDIAGYYYGQATFYIWVEGWDAECYNALYEDVINAYLAFDLQ